jgi:hypothetical protein
VQPHIVKPNNVCTVKQVLIDCSQIKYLTTVSYHRSAESRSSELKRNVEYSPSYRDKGVRVIVCAPC